MNRGKKNCLEAVKKFREFTWPASEPLDLLDISHFHSDHINCLLPLLERREVKRIITPYVSFPEKLRSAV